MRKVYYSLKPVKGLRIRRPKKVVYAYVRTGYDDEYIQSAACDENVWEFSNPDEFSSYLLSLPDKTWILTYSIENWTSVFTALISGFEHMIGTGNETRVIDLILGDKKVTVIDIFQYTAASLPEAVQKYTEHIYKPRSDAIVSLFHIRDIWERIVETCELFKCYPSMTPGATALKIWKHFLPERINSPGALINKFARSAFGPPALHWKPGVYNQAYMYDINASYPSVMANIRYPVRARMFHRRPPPSSRWIARVKINYETKHRFSPISIELADGTHVCPTKVVGSVITMTYIGAMTLETTGKFEIIEWIEGVYWTSTEEIDAFGSWSDAIETASQNLRYKAPLKIISRSLHSKFAQKPYYTQVEIVRPDPTKHKQLVKQGKLLDIIELPGGEDALKIATRRMTGFRAFNIPAWEALTMDAARFRLYASMDENTIYMHTDAIISTEVRGDLTIGTAFGEWKEKAHGEAFIAGIGLYVIGEELGRGGMKTSRTRAREGIISAAQGITNTVQVLYDTGIFSPLHSGKSRFTVAYQVYPKAVLYGTKAYVTRSPTRLIKRKIGGLILFAKGGELWL